MTLTQRGLIIYYTKRNITLTAPWCCNTMERRWLPICSYTVI